MSAKVEYKIKNNWRGGGRKTFLVAPWLRLRTARCSAVNKETDEKILQATFLPTPLYQSGSRLSAFL